MESTKLQQLQQQVDTIEGLLRVGNVGLGIQGTPPRALYVNDRHDSLWYCKVGDDIIPMEGDTLVGTIERVYTSTETRKGKPVEKFRMVVSADYRYYVEAGIKTQFALACLRYIAGMSTEALNGVVQIRVRAGDDEPATRFAYVSDLQGRSYDYVQGWRDMSVDELLQRAQANLGQDEESAPHQQQPTKGQHPPQQRSPDVDAHWDYLWGLSENVEGPIGVDDAKRLWQLAQALLGSEANEVVPKALNKYGHNKMQEIPASDLKEYLVHLDNESAKNTSR